MPLWMDSGGTERTDAQGVMRPSQAYGPSARGWTTSFKTVRETVRAFDVG